MEKGEVGGRLAVPAFPPAPTRVGQALPLHRCFRLDMLQTAP